MVVTEDKDLRRGDTHRKAAEGHSRHMEGGQGMTDMGKVAMTRPMQQALQPHLFEQVSIRTVSNTRLKHQAVAHPTMARLAEGSPDLPRRHLIDRDRHNAHTRSRLFRRPEVMTMDTVLQDMSKAMADRGMTVSLIFTIIISTVVV
jgi:hypothetical protein